jgi:hypothetical protein
MAGILPEARCGAELRLSQDEMVHEGAALAAP